MREVRKLEGTQRGRERGRAQTGQTPCPIRRSVCRRITKQAEGRGVARLEGARGNLWVSLRTV